MALRRALKGIAAAGAMALAAMPLQAAAQDGGQGAVVAPLAEGAAPCELHVWGAGRPHFRMPAWLLARQEPAEMDLGNPLSNASIYSTVNRAGGLPESELRRLFPGDRPVAIIRHDSVVDLDATPLKALRSRLAPSGAACYADLVLANIYGIFPNPDFQGLLIEAVKGGNRLVIDFWLLDHTAAGKPPLVIHKRDDGPLLSFRAPRTDYALSLQSASEVIIAKFADTVREKRGKAR